MIPGSVRAKIITNSTVVLLILTLATLYTGLASSVLARSVEVLFRNNLVMEELKDSLANTEASLSQYLTNKGSDSLRQYIRDSTLLAEQVRKLDRTTRPDETVLLQRTVGGLMDRFLVDAEGSVEAKRGRDVAAYAERFEQAETSADLARELIGRIESAFMADSLNAFTEYNSRISATLASNAAMVIAATLLSLTIMVRYAYKVTEPLSRLAEAARAVGRGEYDHELPAFQADDEIATTASAFTSMVRNVQVAFDELRSKAEIEKTLMAERVRVLDMDHKLKAAELLALQTQINPHFLFNTLSAGQQLAMSEDADRTGEFLENLAAFIRYALRSPSRSVLVRDEMECTQRYVWLLQLRFGERCSFDIKIDEDVLDVHTPALIIQPLVENAVTHGLRNRECGGMVTVRARREPGSIRISVADSGDGMNEAEIERAFAESSGGDVEREGGIGLRNVIRRVDLATAGVGRVEIASVAGMGTTVSVLLPLEEVAS
ncbi:MAG: HAMP domain-containing protein [Spirochaetales bacterium]|nr:MAG: HAMP domain-containing protein [Spirochaetales bacterium]